jgi:hypothetical protein
MMQFEFFLEVGVSVQNKFKELSERAKLINYESLLCFVVE